MRRLAIPLVLVAALFGGTAAGAKEPPRIAVCGRSLGLSTERACLHLDHRDRRAGLLVGSIGEPFHMRPRPRPAPFYTITVRSRRDGRWYWDWSFVYVPSRSLVRQTTSIGMVRPRRRDVYWRTVPSDVKRVFETLGQRLRPFPAPRRW
jgi:hypothetical protein